MICLKNKVGGSAMMMSQRQSGIIISVLIGLFFTLCGCGQEEIQKLRAENEALKKKVAALEQEISKLKETPDYHYQQGVNFLAANKYDEAKASFEIVIEKYPTSPLVPYAKQQLEKVKGILAQLEAQRRMEEMRRIEEEKYRPRSLQEAMEEWIMFRKNEEVYKGRVTTWRFKVMYVYPNGNFSGCLNLEYWPEYQVYVRGPEGEPDYYLATWRSPEKFPRVKEEDWVVVTGEFDYVSSSNEVVLKAIRVKNEGYR
jgi:tetratricopeptide (TPR) repeat protein